MNLEDSFTLLSSMSPKLLTSKRNRKKVPTVLSLKKPLRRSSILDNIKQCERNNSLTLAEESSSETVSTLSSNSIVKKKVITSTIVISDSEDSVVTIEDSFRVPEDNVQKCNLSDTKYEKVAEWVSKVNSELEEVICTSSFKSPVENHLNEDPNNSEKRLLEVPFKVKEDKRNVESSSESNFQSLNVSVNEKEIIFRKGTKSTTDSSKGSEKSIEDVLDDIYGDSWRENRDVILQQTEKKQRKNFVPINLKRITQTDIKSRTKTPLSKAKKVYITNSSSSDEDNDDYRHSDVRTKLNFEERKNSSTNLITNKNYNDVYHSDDDPFDDIGLQFLSLKDRLLKKLKKNEFCNELEKKCVSPKDKNTRFDDENDTCNKKGISGKSLKRKDKKENNKIIDSGFNSHSSNNNNDKKLETKKYFEESPKQASFLSSLSGSLPKRCCDPSALIFRENFKSYKDELAKKLFAMYNEKVFDRQIPSETPIQWNDRMRGSAGFCYCVKKTSSKGLITRKVRIALATKVIDSADRLRDTMIHEMCHAASWIIDGLSDGHGSIWQKWARKAMSIFPELPPITRCHSYKISTKYTYRCTMCGYSIGRHSKSLDIERKRCGYCYGVFEILINKKNKSGEVQSVPVTPKKPPNAFALFVKNHYATYKTPQFNHADVMKLLGQKFSEMKTK